jgi:hypothetical protein
MVPVHLAKVATKAARASETPQPTLNLEPLRAAIAPSKLAFWEQSKCLLEGCSIRSTERLTLNRNTIMRLLIIAGEQSVRLMDARIRDLRPQVFTV